MTEKRFQIIHLGNPYDFVVKDHQTNKTYGTLQGDDKSLMKLLNALHEENQQLKRDMKGYETNYEMFKETPILFVGGVPYVSVREIHKQAGLVVLREKERIKNGEE